MRNYVLDVGNSIEFPTSTSFIVITSEGGTFLGSAALIAGYGISENSIKIISNTSTVIGIGANFPLRITRPSQWEIIRLTNNDTISHALSITYIHYPK